MNRNRSSQKMQKEYEREDQGEYNNRYANNDQYRSLPKQNDLKNRLYDRGFTGKTLPSVKGPESSNSNVRPMTAKLYSFKNKLTPLVYQPQPTILSPTQSKKSPMLKDTEGNMRPGTSNFFGLNQQGSAKMIQPQMTITNEEQNQIMDPYNLSRPSQSRQMMFRPTSSNNLNTLNPLNKLIAAPDVGKKSTGALIRPGTSQMALEFKAPQNQTASNFFQTNQNFNKPSTPATADYGTSKTVIDKISGKRSIHPRYLTGSQKDLNNQGLVPIPDVEDPNNKNDGGNKLFENVPKRPPSNLDKYIELILKGVTNVDEFIYLLKNEQNDDPYDLRVIDYSELKEKQEENQIKEYYTISMKGLTHYVGGRPVEFISLAYWLKERDTYDRIKSLSFFVKFRKWKTLKMWIRNVTRHKVSNYKKALEEKLFILHPTLSGTLLRHRKLCCEMEELRFIEITQQQVEVQKLEDFSEYQEKKRKEVNEMVQDISKRARENVRSGFRECLDKLRKAKGSTHLDDDYTKKGESQPNMVRLKENAYENLGFPENMSYERRSELRKECSRFIRFSYLVDFLALESLSNIYTYSIRDLIGELESLNKEIYIDVVKGDKESGYKGSLFKDPLFAVELQYSNEEISENEVDLIEIAKFESGSHTQVSISEFDILGHVYLEEDIVFEDKKLDEDEMNRIRLEKEASRKFYKQVPRNIHIKRLTIAPNLETIFSTILRCFHEGMNSLQAFERWSKHDELTDYASVLEEWDDMVGDDWDIPESNFLNPHTWIKVNAYSDYGATVRGLLEISFNKASLFIESFREPLTLEWKNSKIDYTIYKNEALASPIETLHNTFALLEWEKEYFEKELPQMANIGLLKIDSRKIKKRILPSPTMAHEEFQKFLPELTRKRLNKINDWLQESINELSIITLNIDQYVQQKLSLEEISKVFPSIKDKILVIQETYVLFANFNIDITKDDQQNLVKTQKNRDQLNDVIMRAEDGTKRNLERFTKDVQTKLIPQLNAKVAELEELVTNSKFLTKATDMNEAINELEKYRTEFLQVQEASKKYNSYEASLELAMTSFENVVNLGLQLTLRYDLWKSLKEWGELSSRWKLSNFNSIDTDEIKTKGDFYYKIVMKCERGLGMNDVLKDLSKMVTEFRQTTPIVQALGNKHLQQVHMQEIREVIGKPDFSLSDDLTLEQLLNMNIFEFQQKIQEISTQAKQEYLLEEKIKEIDEKLKNQAFKTKSYKPEKIREMEILEEIDEIIEFKDESLAELNNILGSRYLKYKRDLADQLQKKLIAVEETIDEWIKCQRQWIYLENIFESPDIKSKLKAEYSEFEKVDKEFKATMKKTVRDRLVLKLVFPVGQIMKSLKRNNETLAKIEKKLADYLENKRGLFPRFYFLSDDELLEILSESANPNAVQPHLKKCFDNIYKLEFENSFAKTMVSSEGEPVDFKQVIQTRTEIENWLNEVQTKMMDTLKLLMIAGLRTLDDPTTDYKKWVQENKGQVVSTISQVHWTQYTENYIKDNGLDEWFDQNVSQIKALTDLVRSDLKSVTRKIIVALVTTKVHARDIVAELQKLNVGSPGDYAWQKQLKYYWDENQDVIIRQLNHSIRYGYEYMGATSRLVVTALTDRCWMTITSALKIHLGAAPAGPAGTGKTESTKDLAKGLGQYCVVFNCSEQIDYKMIGRLFCGLAQQGAWACLDEFNRIEVEVLSVIAQMLIEIRDAKVRRVDKFEFIGNTIPIKEACSVYITMNPGYAGRTELPDNLKVLFRPVSMMIPNYELIAEIMLIAEGFNDASVLASKMVNLYKLSSEQLSQQKHYDFGMRAVKSVLVMAGSLKRMDPTLGEDKVLIRAMRDSNIPKFLKEDIPLFQAIVQDLFPGVEIPVVDYGELKKAVENALDHMKLQKVDKFITKIIQLFETFNVRFGVMLVGEAGSAKTCCYEALKIAMTALREEHNSADVRFQKVDTYVFNPKSISMGELFGEVDEFTKEWSDGLASYYIRLCANQESVNRHWVVFDGPVDALWIENMNTVLDDNMMLCLANSQRIKLRHEMRMLFEVQDLAVASPATVSRCGMVYLTFEDLTWRPYIESWMIKTFPDDSISPEVKKYLRKLFDENIDICLEKIRKTMSEPIQTCDLQMMKSLTNLLEIFLSEDFGFKRNEKIEVLKTYLSYSFAYALIWSFGASVGESSQEKFSNLLKDRFANFAYPTPDLVYSFYFDPKELAFKNWSDKLKDLEPAYVPGMAYWDIFIPTPDTFKYSQMIEWLIGQNKYVFVTGGSGVGKSVIVSNSLRKIQDSQSIIPVFMIFSAKTSSSVTQKTIEEKLQKSQKGRFSAPPGKRNVVFIDDINMPTKEQYGAQPPIELLRQLIDKDKFYDYDGKEWGAKIIERTLILAAAAPPGGGRTTLTPRFTRHFHILCLPQPSDGTLNNIFGAILNGFLAQFQETVRKMAEPIVVSTIEIYRRILKEKPPIPSKFHYTFNLRDVSKVFQGILISKPTIIREPEQICKLWIHEASRIFQDRLINNEDREWFGRVVEELVGRNFRQKWTYDEMFIQNKIYFSDLLRLDLGKDYEEIKDMKKLIKLLGDQLFNYNFEGNVKMNLVFFTDCIEHILRIARILKQPRGNAMLIGVGGSGKQSLTRLAGFIMSCDLFRIELRTTYGENDFKADIQKLMIWTGQEGKQVVFIFTDTQIARESFLENINSILNSGEVPNLWEPEIKDKFMNEMRTIQEQAGKPTDTDSVYRVFVENVRNNLHIVLCMSPIGDALRTRCRQFPSLVDCCTLDWFSAWPREALYNVSINIIQDMDLTPDLKGALAEMCPEIHISATDTGDRFFQEMRRKVFTTPKSYLDLLNLFITLFEQKKEELASNEKRLGAGILKLEKTNKDVAELQITLTELQPQLEKQTAITMKAIEAVKADQYIADEQAAIVEKENEEVNKKAFEIKIIKDQANAELDKALPELIATKEALKNISPEDIRTIRGYPNPPNIVKIVVSAVSALLGENENDWGAQKNMMADVKAFTERLKNYDTENINDQRIQRLQKYMNDLDPKAAEKGSGTLVLLCNWCLSMQKFSVIFKVVEPKKKKVRELTAKYDEACADLAQKQAQLNAVRANVDRLRKECEEKVNLQKSLQEKKTRCERQLYNAGILKSLLADEGKRWEETVVKIKSDLITVVGDTFLSAAIISYFGPFTGIYRQNLLTYWQEKVKELGIPVSDDYGLVKTLGNPSQLRDWQLDGLPSDVLSLDNSILCTKGYRWPLLIDPQLQASKWIKKSEAQNQIRVVKFTDPNFSYVVEGCLGSGYPLLIEDIGTTLEPSIDPILAKQTIEENGSYFIKFGDKIIPYDPLFKLYISTKIPNPDYLPEIFIKTTVINFTVTFEGLDDQLLGDVVKSERPDVEEQRDSNIVRLANNKKELKALEDNILKNLAESKGEILDDEDLIKLFQVAKVTAVDIAKKVAESVMVEIEIEKTRNSYKSVSVRGSILYFVISDLALIDPMYQYSLQYIKDLFNKAIEAAEKSDDLQIRLNYLIDNITRTIYVNVCRGIFEAHKFIFSFLIATSINKQAKILDQTLWNLFLKGAGVVDQEKRFKNPDPRLIGTNEWDLAYFLDQNIERYSGLCAEISNRIESWAEFANSYTIAEDPIPGPYKEKLDSFDKLMLIKIFRPDKVVVGVREYILKQLGLFYIEGLTTTMESLYKDTDKKTPIIFVLSQGADPSAMIERFSKDKNMDEKTIKISLGQGQEEYAERMINLGKRDGLWIILQNCHLFKKWMPRLEFLVEETYQKQDSVHPDYRLILTSMPAPYFPVSVLQNGVKLTTEPPRGLKNNMKRTYADVNQEFLDSCPSNVEALHKMTFCLAFFHAVIQERKKFGPLGWNIQYEFNESDLETSKKMLQMLLAENKEDGDDKSEKIIPWDALVSVTGDINYGGRVTDDLDRKCLLAILRKFYNPDILQSKYPLSENEIYFVPNVGDVESYRSYIDSFPNTDDPEVFGMHENANVAYQTQESDKMLQTILSIQPRVQSSSTGKSNDQIVLELAQQILENLPFNMNKLETQSKELFATVDDLLPSLSTVLLQEMIRFNDLLTTIRSSLKDIQLAIQGTILMSPDLDKLYTSFLNNQVPQIWQNVAYPSLKPLASWIKDLTKRVEFIRSWLVNGNPDCYWLSGFFFPQGFMTGVLQTYSRKTKEAIDTLKFNFKILDVDTTTNKPADGVYINGLYLEGAMWDKKKKTISDQNPGEMYFLMPVIHFNPAVFDPKNRDEPAKGSQYPTFAAPIYKTSLRAGVLSTTGHSTNYVTSVDIPTADYPPEFWVLRGAALLCQLND